MNKEIRHWSVYIEVDNLLKTTLTSLRVLIELRNPSMSERHWAELMKLINVIFIYLFQFNYYSIFVILNLYRLRFLLTNRRH